MFLGFGPSGRISYARFKMSSSERTDHYMAHFGFKNGDIDPNCTSFWNVNIELSRTCRGPTRQSSSFVDNSSDKQRSQHDILVVMLLISFTLSCGGFIVDVLHLI